MKVRTVQKFDATIVIEDSRVAYERLERVIESIPEDALEIVKDPSAAYHAVVHGDNCHGLLLRAIAPSRIEGVYLPDHIPHHEGETPEGKFVYVEPARSESYSIKLG